jgi:hypothetical protein
VGGFRSSDPKRDQCFCGSARRPVRSLGSVAAEPWNHLNQVRSTAERSEHLEAFDALRSLHDLDRSWSAMGQCGCELFVETRRNFGD